MIKEAPYVVVIGIDYSPNSQHALAEALRMTGARAGELHVVHVEHESLALRLNLADAASAQSNDAALEQVRRCVTDKAAEVTKSHGPLGLLRIIAHLRRGSPAEEIAQLAADVDADVVVVGSHGHRGLERFLLGSVAERTNRLARCPVWTVRPKDYDTSGRVPTIEPACPDCLSKRRETNGKQFWCDRHSEHHIRAHVLAYSTDPFYDSATQAYESTPE